MRALAITGIVTVSWISRIFVGSAIRATPPSRRMSAGTRSSAITAHAPASSAMRACSALVTSMITPPLSISARPLLTRIVPVSDTLNPFRQSDPGIVVQRSPTAFRDRAASVPDQVLEAIGVEHPDQPVAHVDQPGLAQLVQHLGQGLSAGADHLCQLHVGEPLVDADAVRRHAAIAVHQLEQLAGKPRGHGAERERLDLILCGAQPL